MTAVPPAVPGRAWNKRLKESREFICLLLEKADMRVVQIIRLVPGASGPLSTPCGHSARAMKIETPATSRAVQNGGYVSRRTRLSRRGLMENHCRRTGKIRIYAIGRYRADFLPAQDNTDGPTGHAVLMGSVSLSAY